MKYTGEFISIDNTLYKIEITNNKSGSDKTLKLSGTPFVSSIEEPDEKHIYSPIRCGGATVGILTESYIEDFYSGDAKGVKVVLYNSTKNNKVEWTGYVVPSCYSQGFDMGLEELQLDCVDGIAVLKNIPYKSNDRDMKTFASIIFNCLKISGCYRNFYISDNVQIVPNGNENVVDRFRVSEFNFFEDRQSEDQTEDDLAWSCYDVLAQICQFLGYTLVVEGDEVFIIDYDAIKKGNNTYYKYSLEGNTLSTSTRTTVEYSKHIGEGAYAQSGTSLELDAVYNKVSVKCEFYNFDDILGELGDDNFETNITTDTDVVFDAWGGNNTLELQSAYYKECDTFTSTDKRGNPDNYQICIMKGENPWGDYLWVVVNKFYKSDTYKFHRYYCFDQKFPEEPEEYYADSIPSINYCNGAWYVRQYKKKITSNEYNNWRVKYPAKWYSQSKEARKKAWIDLLNTPPEGLNLTPMVIMRNGGLRSNDTTYHIGPAGERLGGGSNGKTDNEDCRHYPFITFRNSQTGAKVFGGDNAYLCIQGTLIQHDKDPYFYGMSDGSENDGLSERKRYKWNDQFFIWARLSWGDSYWNGEYWVQSPTDFKLWFLQNHDDGNSTTVADYFDKPFDIIDTSKLYQVADTKGYYIPTPPQANLDGKVELTIYCPRDMYGWRHRTWFRGTDPQYKYYYNRMTILQNFKIKPIIMDGGDLGLDNEDTDTIYTNVIDENNVEKFDEITFKVCTYDDKNNSYSVVDYLLNGKSTYVRNTYNKSLYSSQNGSVGCDGVNASLRQEEQYIYKLATQYEKPRVILEVNLHNDEHKLYGKYTNQTLTGKTFVPIENQIDYKYNNARIRLIEKA